MYGRYTKDLGEYAKLEARKLKMLERRRKQEDKARDKELFGKRHGKLIHFLSWIWRNSFARLGEDWVTSFSSHMVRMIHLSVYTFPTVWPGVFSFTRNYNGFAFIRNGQRHLNVHKW